MASGNAWPLRLVPANQRRGTKPDIVAPQSPGDPVLMIWMSVSIGQGSTALLLAGQLGNQQVAVKLFSSTTTINPLHTFTLEVAGWSRLAHPHVLTYLGSRLVGLRQVALLMPYMENGNMKAFLEKNPGVNRMQLLREVAEGVKYLHNSAGIVHGDLKCANVLISDHGTALLADFGLSTFIRKPSASKLTSGYIRSRKSVQFAAPELFEDAAFAPSDPDCLYMLQRSKTTYSDVYAFGMLIYEAITGTDPWLGVAENAIARKVTAGERPVRTMHFRNNNLWPLCESCWHRDPFARPDARKILNALGSMA